MLQSTKYTMFLFILLSFISIQNSHAACRTVNLDIQFDNFPRQISWEIVDANNNIVFNSSNYNLLVANTNTTENFCLEDGCYTLNFNDSMSNGMCQGTSITTNSNTINGSGAVMSTVGISTLPGQCGTYKLIDSNGMTLASGGGNFGAQESTTFCIDGPACSTMDLNIDFDNFPTQTNWEILDANSSVVASSSSYSNLAANSSATESLCLVDGCYTLNFNDVMNNGMCQGATTTNTTTTSYATNLSGIFMGTIGMSTSPGQCGRYKLTDSNGTILVSGGGNFGAQQSTTFCVTNNANNRLDDKNVDLLNIYPTMASDFVNIEFNFDLETSIGLAIYDINGKMIDQYLNQIIYANENMQLDITNLNKGSYFIKMNSFGVITTKRFIKL